MFYKRKNRALEAITVHRVWFCLKKAVCFLKNHYNMKNVAVYTPLVAWFKGKNENVLMSSFINFLYLSGEHSLLP